MENMSRKNRNYIKELARHFRTEKYKFENEKFTGWV